MKGKRERLEAASSVAAHAGKGGGTETRGGGGGGGVTGAADIRREGWTPTLDIGQVRTPLAAHGGMDDGRGRHRQWGATMDTGPGWVLLCVVVRVPRFQLDPSSLRVVVTRRRPLCRGAGSLCAVGPQRREDCAPPAAPYGTTLLAPFLPSAPFPCPLPPCLSVCAEAGTNFERRRGHRHMTRREEQRKQGGMRGQRSPVSSHGF